MPITDKQLRYFNENFKRMLDHQHISRNALAQLEHRLLPSTRTVQKIGDEDYYPSDRTIEMVVNYFNHTMPLQSNVSVDEFTSGPITITPVSEHMKKYYGDYRVFYYSDNYTNPLRIHGGALVIYGNEYRTECDLVMAIEEESNINKVFEFLSIKNDNRKDVLRRFNQFRAGLEDIGRAKHTYYCHGKVSITDKSLELNLENPNDSKYSMQILFPINDANEYDTYKGGLGIYTSPACNHLGIRVCKIAAIRDERCFVSLFTAEEKLGKYISMELTEHKRFNLSYDDSEQFRNII